MALSLATAVAAYCLALRRYGFELGDEGVLLAHVDRVLHGQVPYRDFHVGYGPGLYWLHAAAFAWWEPSSGAVRTGLAVVHAVRALLLAALVHAVGGRGWAAAAVVALVAFFLPIAPGVCAPGNVPYPAWYADAIGLGALSLLIRRPDASAAVGMLWGVVFAFKQNSGLFGLGAAALTVVLTATPAERGGRAVAVGLAAALVGGALLLLWTHLDVPTAAAFVVPLLPLAAAVLRRRVAPDAVRALVALGAGFLLVAGAVVAVMVAQAGAGPVAADLLQIGSDTAATYHVPLPSPAAVLDEARAAGGLRAGRIVADAAWFAVLPLVHLAVGVLVARGRLHSRLAVAVATASALGYLQLYPRADYWHLLPLAPASLAALVLLAAALPARAGRVAVAALVAVAIARLAPAVPVLGSLRTAEPAGARTPRLDVRWDLVRDEAVRRLPEVVEAVRGRVPLAGFPALGAINFALGTPSPWRHDYFFPGRPGADEERALAADVAREPPATVVVLAVPSGPFAAAAAAHAVLLQSLEAAMTEERRVGPYRVLVPRPRP
jgi:hypothetical protein